MRHRLGDLRRRARQALRLGAGRVLGPRRRREPLGIVFAYHTVDDGLEDADGLEGAKGDGSSICYPGNSVSMDRFERHLELFRASGRPLVSLGELLAGETPGGIALTFDDGYKGCWTNVAPRLEADGIPATFFVCPGWIDDGQGKWDDLIFSASKLDGVPFDKSLLRRSRQELEPLLTEIHRRHPDLVRRNAENLMTWDQVRDLVDRGFEVGSHTLRHPYLTAESAADQEEEMHRSRRRLSEQLDRDIRYLAYPFGSPGSFDSQTADIAETTGYEAALACGDRYLTKHSGSFAVPRFAVGPKTSDAWLKLVLSGYYF